MVGNFPVDVHELLDHGPGRPPPGMTSRINRGRCVHDGCHGDSVHDSGFCAPCLAWALGQADDELPVPEAGFTSRYSGPYPPGNEDEWNDYLNQSRRMT